jgi:formylglycine-generating enzyme required for sulfatase activity
MRWPPLADSDLWALRERLRVGDLVIVVGEGLDDGLLTTEALLRSLAEGLPADRRASCLQRIGKGQLGMAAAVIERHNAQGLTTAARRTWSLEGKRGERPPLYAALAALPCRGFVTTAFHPRLHDAVAAGRAGALLLTPANRATMGDLDGRTGWVFHLLGCAALAERCALTTTDLDTLRADPAWRSAVTQLAGGSLLFVGCGAEVGPLRELLADLQSAHGRDRPAKHAWLGTCADDDKRHELQGLGLQVLDLGEVSLQDALRFLGEPPADTPPAPCPVVDLAHLRAEVRKRTDGLPWLSDLLGVGVSLAEVTVEVSVRSCDTARPRRGAAAPEDLATRRLSLPDVLGLPARHHALVGEAGSGKSTLLRHLVQHLQERGGGEPVYLHCRRLLREGRPVGLEAALGDEYGDLAWPAVAAARDQRTLVILLDGLDEAAAALGGDAVRTAVGALLGNHPGCRVLIASRPEAKAESLGVPLVRVLPVEENDAVALLAKLGVKTPEPKAVIAELRADPARRSLAESPLLLTLLAAVLKDHGGLPTSRAEIYNSAVELLLDRRFAPDGCEAGKIKSPGLARELLEHICGRLHASERDPWLTIDIRDAFQSGDTTTLPLNSKLERTWSDLTAFLDSQALQVGLLVKGGKGDTWEAPHRTLREYLAARGMVAELRAGSWPASPPAGVAWALEAAKARPAGYAELFALMVGEAARVRTEMARSAIPLRWVVETGQVEVAWRALRDAKAIESGTAAKLWALRRKYAYGRDVDVHTLTSRLTELVERPSEAVALLAEWLKGATNNSERFWCIEALKNLSAGLGAAETTLREWCAALISGAFDDIPAARREAALKELDRWGWGAVPAGLHWVGSPEGVGPDNEWPQHRVRVTEPFRLMTVPVTHRLYACFDASRAKGSDDRPVVTVDWYDAALFAAWIATLRPDLATCRLPTETEWEIGARGGTATAYWSGDSEADLLRVGWIYENMPKGGQGAQPAGQKAANAFGLRDVHGNVREWCSDPWDAEAWRKRVALGAAAGTSLAPPAAVAARSAGRVIRGGSWLKDPDRARAAYRSWTRPTDRGGNLGIRLALAPRPRS